MKVLVTGGAGFIGSHVTDMLLTEGIEVVVLDDLSTGKKENVNEKAEFIKGNISNPRLVEKIFSENRIEKICHLAAQTSIEQSMKSPAKDAETNIVGTLNLLDAASRAKIGKFVFASSAAVYGFPEKEKLEEEDAKKPFSPYGISKLACEEYIEFYAKRARFGYCNLRYGNVFGPRQSPELGGVVAKFMRKMLCGIPPTIFGSGEQTRDFVFVEDAARAAVLALESGESGNFNVSQSKQESVLQMFKKLSALTGFEGKPQFAPALKEVESIQLDCSLAREKLGWEPAFSSGDGLKKTVEWMRSKLD